MMCRISLIVRFGVFRYHRLFANDTGRTIVDDTTKVSRST